MRRVTVRAAAVLAVGACALVSAGWTSSGGRGCAGSWQVMLRLDRALQYGSATVASRNNVWLVGGSPSNVSLVAVAEHWDGRRWHRFSPVIRGAESLEGVAVTQPNEAWAVAYSGIARWNGDTWSVVSRVRDLSHIAAVGRDVWAVGFGEQKAVRSAGGGRFLRTRVPGEWSELYSVLPRSSRDVWALGHEPSPSGSRTLALHWNGRAWRIVPSPDLPNVNGVRPDDEGEFFSDGALAPDGTLYAVASPTGANARLERWDGRKWAQVPWPVQDSRADLAVRSHSDIWAAEVDDVDRSFIHHWDGARWISSRPPGGITRIGGIAGGPGTDIWLWGERRSGSGVALRLRCA